MDEILKKATAASSGALMTSLIVTPLDVVKVRMQSQIQENNPRNGRNIVHHTHYHQYSTLQSMEKFVCKSSCRKLRCELNTRTSYNHAMRGDVCLRYLCSSSCNTPVSRMPVQFEGTTHALRHIFQTEGIKGLFAGLSPTLLIAVPSTVLYYVTYDKLLKEGQSRYPEMDQFVPLFAGASSRVIAVTATSPIELIRTRMQGNSISNGMGMMKTFEFTINRGGYQSLFNGLGATLARDVPFSAIYWTTYESLKKSMISNDLDMHFSKAQNVFICGAAAGVTAATFTTPFDVVKTLQQVHMKDISSKSTNCIDLSTKVPSTKQMLQEVIATSGVKGLFTGLTARLARVGPSCAIMISCYELGKQKLGLE